MPELTSAPPDNQDQTNGDVAVVAPGGLADDQWLALAREAYGGSTQYFDSAIRRRLLDDLRQFQSQHPQGSKYESDAYRSRSKFFRPKTRAAVRKNEAIAAEAFFASEDVIAVKAVDPDDPVKRASAEINKQLLQYRLTHSIPWFLTVLGAYQDSQVQGVVVSRAYWDYRPTKGIDRPAVQNIPLENFRFDPSADWRDPVNTSPYLIELVPMYVRDVKARMQTIDDKTGQPKWRSVPDAALQKATTRYNEVVRLQREAGRVDPQQAVKTGVNAYTVVWVQRHIHDVDGVDYVFHTLAEEALLDTPQPLANVNHTQERPYVVGFCVVESHRAYKDGPVRLTRDVQMELNENANQRSDNVKFAMNKRYLVKRTAQVDTRSLHRNVPSSTTMVNDVEGDVKVIETADVTSSAYAEQDRLNLDFDDLAGSFSQASVQSNRKLNETVGGMNILTKDASQISGYQLRTFVETWARPLLRKLVKLEQHYETDEVILALAGKQAGLYERFGVSVITDELLMHELALDVNVGLSATSPHDQLDNFTTALLRLREILADGVLVQYGLAVEELFKEFFGKLGYKDGKRFFPGEENPAVTALRAQVQTLQQAIDAKHPPELLQALVQKALAEVAKIKSDAVKTGVDSMYSSVQTAEVISAVPQVAPVADKVMQASGYQSPNPPGVDPNLPQPAGGGAVTVNPIANRRTGMQFTPGGGGAAAGDTTPNTPAAPPRPASPGTGAASGIETIRPDGVLTNGG